MSVNRLAPESFAKQLDYPDPARFSIINCPYCIDAREQIGSRLAGCIRHTNASPSDSQHDGGAE